jgi:hypothetical protein
VVSLRLVRLVEGVRLAEFALVVFELLLLFGCQDCKLPLLLDIFRIGRPRHSNRCISSRQVVVVSQIREHVLLPAGPGVVMVVGNVDHVVCVDCSERSETVTNDGKESHQYAVDDVDNVDLLSTDVDPTDEEEHPSKTEERDECGIERDQEAKC